MLVVVLAIVFDLLGSGPHFTLRNGTFVPWGGLALLLATYWVLVLRWRYPLSVFVHFSVIYVAMAMLTEHFTAMIPMFIAVYALARKRSARVGLIGLALLVIATVIVSSFDNLKMVSGLIMVALQCLAFVLGRVALATERRHIARQAELAMNAQRDAALAVQAERRQLARDLHDIVSHSVSAMLLQAAGARALLDGGGSAGSGGTGDTVRVAEALSAIEHAGVQATHELRRLLGFLREEVDSRGDVEGSSLTFLDSLVETTRLSGVDVSYEVSGEPVPLEPALDLTAFRVVQESLANVMKHAGPGAQASVMLSWAPEELNVKVRSTPAERRPGAVSALDAVPTPQELPGGFGLRGLAERLDIIGGTFNYGQVAGGGFLTSATLPLSVSPLGGIRRRESTGAAVP